MAHDADLVQRIRESDSAAFEILFRMHSGSVLRFAESFVAERDAAEDLLQEVFGWVWTHRADWYPATDTLTYLLGAVRHRALDRIRNERSRERITSRYSPLEEAFGSSRSNRAIEETLDEQQHMERIWTVIETLSERQRAILALRWKTGLDWPEISTVMRMSIAAAKMQHSRALQAVRERLPRIFE